MHPSVPGATVSEIHPIRVMRFEQGAVTVGRQRMTIPKRPWLRGKKGDP